MSLLEIKNLHVEIESENKKILNGLSLTIEKGQVAAIMGPNGSGKSTLAYVLAGKPGYTVTEGDVLLDGESVLEMGADERAAKGVFLAFQYPVEVPGVATMTFLRTALNAQRKLRGEAEVSTPEFIKLVRERSSELGINQDMLRRGVDIVVATPGRLLDHVSQRTVDLSKVEVLVLDEADRMLDMGFIHDIKRVITLLPRKRQNLLFSATFSPDIRKLAEGLLQNPVSIDIAPRNSAATISGASSCRLWPAGIDRPLTECARSRQIASTSYSRPIGALAPHNASTGQDSFLSRSARSCSRSIDAPAR